MHSLLGCLDCQQEFLLTVFVHGSLHINIMVILPGTLTENLFILRAMKSSRGSLPTLGSLVLQAPTEIRNFIFTKALQKVR